MMVAFQVRRATAADTLAVTDLWIRARRTAMRAIPACVHGDGEVGEWTASIIIPRQPTWITKTERRLTGMMSLDDGWVDQLYVDPDWTDQGIGSMLIRLAKECYPQGLQLWTFESNISARRFYERYGFVAMERTDGPAQRGRLPRHTLSGDSGDGTPLTGS
ncbi:MAG: GNAT family N-acetyltransferase [Sulfobacillus sp.]